MKAFAIVRYHWEDGDPRTAFEPLEEIEKYCKYDVEKIYFSKKSAQKHLQHYQEKYQYTCRPKVGIRKIEIDD